MRFRILTLAAAVFAVTGCGAEPTAPNAATATGPRAYLTSGIVVECQSPIGVGETSGCTAWTQTPEGYWLALLGASWSSSEPWIASIDQRGIATGVSYGTATISATYDGTTGYGSVQVSPPLTVSIHGPDQVGSGQECGFWASIQGATSATYSWQASGATGVASGPTWQGQSSESAFTLSVTAYSGGRAASDSKTVTLTPAYLALCQTSAG
jgi:hypothetical protein